MSEQFNFETFADTQGVDFREYLSLVVTKLPKADERYRAICDRISAIYEQHPRVIDVFDREDVSALIEQKCGAVNEIASLQNQRMEMELEASTSGVAMTVWAISEKWIFYNKG